MPSLAGFEGIIVIVLCAVVAVVLVAIVGVVIVRAGKK